MYCLKHTVKHAVPEQCHQWTDLCQKDPASIGAVPANWLGPTSDGEEKMEWGWRGDVLGQEEGSSDPGGSREGRETSATS